MVPGRRVALSDAPPDLALARKALRFSPLHHFGQVAECSKAHAWRAELFLSNV